MPTGTGDGRSRGDFSQVVPFLVGAATSCHCPADRQSYLCRLRWRWHRPLSRPLSAPSGAGEHWAVLLAPAATQRKEKSGSRTAVPTREVNTLHVGSHKRGQPRYLQQQVLAFTVGKEGFHRDGFLNLSTSVVVWLRFRQLRSVWIWLWAPLSQGCRRLTALLTILLLPDDGTDDVKGKCQDFASCFPRNGAMDDEECCIYFKFRLSCCSGSFLHKAQCMPSLPVSIPCSTKLL